MNHSTILLLLEVEISLFIFFSHSWQRLTQMQCSTFFTFRHFILLFGCSFVAETITSELLYHIFVSRSRDIIIDIFLSFAAEANANAILYIFHFQTLHTVFFGAHLWQRLTQVNHSTTFLLLEVEISLFIFSLIRSRG